MTDRLKQTIQMASPLIAALKAVEQYATRSSGLSYSMDMRYVDAAAGTMTAHADFNDPHTGMPHSIDLVLKPDMSSNDIRAQYDRFERFVTQNFRDESLAKNILDPSRKQLTQDPNARPSLTSEFNVSQKGSVLQIPVGVSPAGMILVDAAQSFSDFSRSQRSHGIAALNYKVGVARDASGTVNIQTSFNDPSNGMPVIFNMHANTNMTQEQTRQELDRYQRYIGRQIGSSELADSLMKPFRDRIMDNITVPPQTTNVQAEPSGSLNRQVSSPAGP